jgi:hypothetical protein
MNFREYIEITEKSLLKKMYAAAKRVFSGGENEFIAPLLKGVKPFKGDSYKEYKLFVDYTEVAVYYDDKIVDRKKMDTMSVPEKLKDDAHKMVLKYGDKMQVDEDNENKFYLFVSGIGKESDIKDFVKENLKNVDYISQPWEF